MKHVYSKLSLFLLLASGILLTWAGIRYYTSQAQNKAVEEARQELATLLTTPVTVSTTDLIASLTPLSPDSSLATLDSAAYLALFVIAPTVCTACVVEVKDFSDLLYQRYPIVTPIVLVQADSLNQAHEFYQRSQFPIPGMYATPERLAHITTLNPEQGPNPQILAFLDTNQNQVFRRTILATRITPLGYKEELLYVTMEEHNSTN